MKRAALLLPLAVMVCAGCATTGNPREGGLFGWSETKARERVADRRTQVAAADAELAREKRLGAIATEQTQRISREETVAAQQRNRAIAKVEKHQAAISAKVALLESESPTPATASRAHRLRVAVETTRRDLRLSPSERARKLHRLELEIDEARAEVRR